MKKVIFTVNIDNYCPELVAITRPYLEQYAAKIRAEICDITERKFPDKPRCYEKFQIYQFTRDLKADWAIYFDQDALIHPNLFDITEFISKDTVLFNGKDMANNRWYYDHYFRRDGRHIGACSWFVVCSDWTIDLWQPDPRPTKEIQENIHPVVSERNAGLDAAHLIDDYVLSRNIARYGLKHRTMEELCGGPHAYFFHIYTDPPEIKAQALRAMVNRWETETQTILTTPLAKEMG